MHHISIAPKSGADAALEPYLAAFKRRVSATPPGMCPIALQVSLLEACQAQTCGKCIPCRDGIPQLVALLRDIRDCKANEDTLAKAKTLARMIASTSDCAIGWHAAAQVLEGIETFAAEYEAHTTGNHTCTESIGQTVPCETHCPAHVNVPGYIALISEGDPAGAVAMVRKDNPFPTACGLICDHPCEAHCRRGIIDAQINIRGLKRYAVDNAPANTVPVPNRLPDTGKKIAVIGGGVSGLTCAYYSALMGHSVTVFEAHKKLGGMVRYGIPEYRFPRHRLDEDIEAILSVGGINVELETYVDAALMQRINNEYDAIYVAIGAQGGKTLGLEGDDAEGVMSAVEMLGRIGDGDYPDFTGKNVVVIGGGNVAMDCVRTSVRLGAQSVSCAYRRRVEDMTAAAEEIENAIAEGVEMMTLEAPVRIEVEDGHCTAVITQPQYISAVKRGRPAPAKANKPETRTPADVVIVAIGQDIETEDMCAFGLEANRGRFVTDTFLKAKGTDKVFVGGDCQSGPKDAVLSIGMGKAAARNIDSFLGYNHKIPFDIEVPAPKQNDRTAYGRVNNPLRLARERKNDFEHDELPMSFEEAMQESSRCLRCDHFGCGVLTEGRVQHV